MHNKRCKHHCCCKRFETLLQVTENVCKYAEIVMTSDKFLPPAKDIIKDKSQHTDKNVKMKELELELIKKDEEIQHWLQTQAVSWQIVEAESKRKDEEIVALNAEKEKMKGLESELWKRKDEIRQKDEEILNLKKHIEHMQNMNINDLISNQNKRHKEHEEQNLKQKEIHLKQLEKREFMKSAKFCNFCDLYQNNEAHFCNLFQNYIRVDERNLVFITGTTQDDVLPTVNDDVLPTANDDGQPTAKDEKTKSSREIQTYPNKTSMFNKLSDMAKIMKQGVGHC